ncbi:streptophobe family protein [Streptomyces sp. NPDC059989]|uniref:streptophobe family protein n=1 Tax=Streptomyces sp. NPDC059989 TaxID=3347026 RepID=UPI00369474E5
MRRIRWGDVILSGVAAVGWSLAVMAGVAALGLHLLGADEAGGSLGAMTAAVVVLAVGGTVTPSGDLSVFGVGGAGAETSLDVMPLGVGLAGALVLAGVFLRSLRTGAAAGEQVARAVVVVALLVGAAGGLAWVGHDMVTLDGAVLPLPKVPPKIEIPGVGDIGGLLPDRVGDLIEARARVGFSVEPGPTLVGAGLWALGVLAVALAASRRGPAALARIRPAVTAVVTVLLVAVAAGLAAAVWAALGDEHPRQVLGAALLGAPNGAWLGVLLGLFVPLRGQATGAAGRLLPDPVDELLGAGAGAGAGTREPVTVFRLAEYDGRVWLLVVGAGLLLLAAGVLAAVRTPGRGIGGCAARLSVVTGVAAGVVVWGTGLSADASVAVLGVDAVGAGVELRAVAAYAVLLGAVWGAAAGAAGALLAGRPRRSRPTPTRPAPAWPDPAWPDPTRPNPAWPDPARSDPGWPDPARSDPARSDPRPGAGAGPDAPTAPGLPGPDGGTAPYDHGHGHDHGHRGGAHPYRDPDVSWDVTVTGIPPRPPRPARPSRRPPFTPPPPPEAPPPPPKPQGPPDPPR